MSFKHMKTMLSHSGDTIRQSKINDAKVLMNNQLMTDPSYNPNMVFWQFGIKADEFETITIKTFDEKYSAANGFTVLFNTLINTPVIVGDVIYDKKRDIYWVCTESYDRDEILCAGKLTRCNYWMKWQNKNKDIFEYPVFEINSTQYNSGETGNKTMTLGSSQHLITTVADENTLALNHGQRVFWDRNSANPTVFKITQNDTTAANYDKGLVKITITEGQYNPTTDSIEEWLCDYKPQVQNIVAIAYKGSPVLRIGGNKILTADTTGVVSSWTVDNPNVTISSSGNSAIISCASNEDYIGQSFKVTAVLTTGEMGKCSFTIVGGV